MSWVKKLLKEYAEGKKALEAYRMKLIPEDAAQLTEAAANELIIVNSMISDMQFAIDWMRKSRNPGSRRGADRRAAYQRTVLRDVDLFPSLAEPAVTRKSDRLSGEARNKVLVAIHQLSERELNCYLLHAAKGLSYAEIGRELKISRYTVRQYIERAKSKVGQAI